tara:strand:- start:996 stop:2264 length:1269 start_codon:yes stop_codon:yes gene_type:complete
MNDIICPNCEKAFKVDKAGYAEILKQVRDHQFEEELTNRLALAKKDKEQTVELEKNKVENTFKEQLLKKDNELIALKAQFNNELSDKLTKKESVIAEMKSKIENAEVEKKLALSEAIRGVEKERDNLLNELKNKDTEKELLKKSLNEKHLMELNTKDNIIKMKDEEIILRKDLKLKLSTKMLGETLEQHCEAEFNKLRATGFQNAYFEKDNEINTGSKGDFIYRETDDDGNEFISIMFEMKNEGDETATKKKNEDFLKELDKDRNEKKCEFAVLVTLLETDSELYNSGIVDMSHKFNKMYVVRPQFFIPIITLLRNASMNSLEYRKELNLMRNQNIDITNFEDKLSQFTEGFAKNYNSASNHFQKAILEIDKSIARMQKVKQELTTSENQLRLANKKAEDLTIKKLTYKNPTMREKFEKVKS